jgi:hypothetical protein
MKIYSSIFILRSLIAMKKTILQLMLLSWGVIWSNVLISEILFEENFDSQPDWHSGLIENDLDDDGFPDRVLIRDDGYLLPDDWYSSRQDPSWAPSVGYSNGRESIEILSKNSSLARGGVGKSYVSWRDATEGPTFRWNSDSILSQFYPDGLGEVYVRFWIKFDPNWTQLGETGSSKLFRISSWDGAGTIYGFGGNRYNGPVVFWDYKATNSGGVRNSISLRGFPIDTNYFMATPPVLNMPRSSNNGDYGLNFDNNIRDLDGDGVEDNEVTLKNLVSGEALSGIVGLDEVYGDTWHKIEFYVKMNSSAGAYDGVLTQWIDDQLVFRNVTIPWMGSESTETRKWNVISFGGNDHFHSYPDSERRQEWYSIDDIVIADKPFKTPKPPSSIGIN